MRICYYQLDAVDSTNAWAKRHLELCDTDTLVVISADEQTSGRGRWGRVWVSPPKKNGSFSLMFKTDAPSFCLSQLVVLVLQEVLEQHAIQAEIKWPNDLLVQGKKISGILLERLEDVMIIGIGLNINATKEDLDTVSQPVTSMLIETGQNCDVQKIIHECVERFIQAYSVALADRFSAIMHKWHEKVQWMLYQDVAIQTAGGQVKGVLKELDPSGRAIVETKSGMLVIDR